MTTTYNQDPTAILDYTQDWSSVLALNGAATITDATVVGSTGAVVTDVSPASTSVTWRLAFDGDADTVPGFVECVVHVTLSTGEEDERTTRVQITDL